MVTASRTQGRRSEPNPRLGETYSPPPHSRTASGAPALPAPHYGPPPGSNIAASRCLLVPATQPLDGACLFSYLTLSWLTPLMVRGLRFGSDENSIPPLSVHDASAKNAERLHLLWEEEVSRHGIENASVLQVMLRFQRTRLIFTLFVSLLYWASVSGPLLIIPKFLEYSEEQSGNIVYGVGLCFALFLTECLKSLALFSCWVINQHTGMRYRTAVSSLAFEKLIQFKSLKHISTGEVVSFFTTDVNHLSEGVYYGPLVLLACSALIACGIASYLILGPTVLTAIFSCLLIFPLGDRTVVVSDRRIRATAEVLTSIKLIKMYAWEKPFAAVIKDLRKKERKLLEKAGLIQSLTSTVFLLSPVVSTVIMFLIHTALKLKLTPSVDFTAVAALNPLWLSVFLVPFAIKGLTNSKSAADRFKKFFLQESPVLYVQMLKDPSKALVLEGATLSWRQTYPGIVNGTLELESNGHTHDGMAMAQPPSGGLRPEDKGVRLGPELHKTNLAVSKETVMGICSNTGSGKSSLLSAILGEMYLLEGLVGMHGSLAYVPQQAWIIGGSVRENILMGGQYDKARYLQVLHCCSLKQDLEILPFGDMTEIGDQGLNISGGQKQRISLARAVYSNREVYLLDDPLSAVDTRVGKHIFEECIKKTLRGKTIILMAHQLQYLEFCDQIVLLEDGKICETGTHNELIEKKGRYAQLIQRMHKEATQNVSQDVAKTAEKSPVEGQAGATSQEEPVNENAGNGAGKLALENQLTKKEKMKEGSLSWRIYHHYIQAAGGYTVSIMVCLLMVVNVSLMTFISWWLSYWLEQGSGTNGSRESNGTKADPGEVLVDPQLPFDQLVYGLSALLLSCTGVCSSFLFTRVTRKVSTALHNKLFSKLVSKLQATARFGLETEARFMAAERMLQYVKRE
ncbi:LOW QUALITY PROTEIN: ATP-binding cassette sub-family C member 11-like [Dugong dugon]